MTAQVHLPAGHSSKTASYEPHIDGLRAVAVIAVVVFHAFPSLLPGGYVGVDVFFVISGYLITRIILRDLQRQSFSVRDFYGRRVRRIFPALSLVLATGLLFGWAVLLPSEWESLGQQTSAGAFFLSNWLSARGSGYFDAPSESNPLLHLWSLAIEEQFYLAWPFLLILAYRLRNTGPWALAIVGLASFFGYYVIEDSNVAFFSTLTRVWQLTIGGMIAWFSLHPWSSSGRQSVPAVGLFQSSRPTLSTLGLCLIAISAIWLTKSTPYPGAAALAPTLGAALVILGGAGATEDRRLLVATPLVVVGLISYPLYLWHWPLLAFARKLNPQELTVTIRLVLISLAVALSIATYRLIELPVRRSGTLALMGLVYAMATLGLVGYYAHLGRLVSYSTFQPGTSQAIEAHRDWVFPPSSLAPVRINESVFYGRSGIRPSVVFIGDSNVQQFAPRVDTIAESEPRLVRNILFATRSGCLPIRGFTADSTPDCDAFLADALSAALSDDVSAVVIGAAWHTYFTTRNVYYLRAIEGSRQEIAVGTSGAIKAFATLATMIRELRGAGKDVFLVLNIPVGPEFDPTMTVSRPLIGQLLSNTRTKKGRHEVEEMLSVVNDRLIEVADISDAKIINPIEFLCSLECSQFDASGAPRYQDATHLRASYVRREVKFLDANLLADDRK